MPYITTRDGTQIFYKDWGHGMPVLFSHGWPLNADAWEDQMKLVAENGYRGIAHDRRGHGRSSQPWDGYNFDSFADDLNDLVQSLDLRDFVLVGHSMGGGEVARYIGRHGTERVAKVVLLSAVTPSMLKTDTNPEGVPERVFEDIKRGILAERSQFWKDLSESFFGANRPGNKVTQGNRDAFWLMAMQGSIEAAVKCVDAFAYTDFTEDLAKIPPDVPTFVIHGDDDQIVPIGATARRTAEIVPNAMLKVYQGASHGIAAVPGDKEKFNEDLFDFLKN